MTEFTTKNGEVLQGKLVHSYGAFEGGMRYIFETSNGRQYRCVKVDDRYVEYVA